MFLSQYLEGQVADWILGTAFPTAPVSLTIALSTANPLDTGLGLAEPSGGSYAQQTITFDAPTVEVSGVQIASSAAITFPTATADWGTITHIAVFAGANMLFYGQLAAARLVSNGDTFSIAINNIQHTFQPQFSTYLGTQVANWIRGTAMPTAPVSVDMALSTADPLVSGSGLVEPPGTDGYTREVITFGTPVPVSETGTTITNDIAIIFGPANTNDWPSVTYAAIFASTDMLLFGTVAVARTAEVGDAIPFAIGAVSLLIR